MVYLRGLVWFGRSGNTTQVDPETGGGFFFGTGISHWIRRVNVIGSFLFFGQDSFLFNPSAHCFIIGEEQGS